MRVLWFTNTSCNYSSSNGYNGGGWMHSAAKFYSSPCITDIFDISYAETSNTLKDVKDEKHRIP